MIPRGWQMAWYEPRRRIGVYYPAPLHWLLRGFAKSCTACAQRCARPASNARKFSRCSARIASASTSRKSTREGTWLDGANVFRRASPRWKRKSRAWTIAGTLDRSFLRRQNLPDSRKLTERRRNFGRKPRQSFAKHGAARRSVSKKYRRGTTDQEPTGGRREK